MGKRMCRMAGQRLVRQRKGSRRAGVFLFLLMRAFRRSRKARCFLKGSARPLCRGRLTGESVGAVVASHLPEKSALGEGEGDWGRGLALFAAKREKAFS